MGALDELVERHTVAALRDGPYTPPDDDLVAALPALVDALVEGAALAGPAAALGLAAVELDGRTVLHPPRPGGPPWVLLAPGAGVGPLVQVPHPYADLHTERVALGVLARSPGATLLQAGAHRVAAGPRSGPERFDRDAYPADVARRPDALFSRLAEALVARRGVAQVQLHGFADRDDRDDVDVVVSSGAATPGELVAGLTATLAAQGLRVRDPDHPGCADLAGRRNAQGLAACRHGTPFAHLELSRAVRDDPRARGRVAAAIAEALGA